MVLCRCENHLSEEIKDKISLFCSIRRDLVLDEVDVEHSIYEVPLSLHEQKVDSKIVEFLKLPDRKPNLKAWQEMIHKLKNPQKKLVIGVVGKYMQLEDAYKSVFEALSHAATDMQAELEIRIFESDKIVNNGSVEAAIKGCDGYLVPGGFGERGWIGKILTAQYCREHKIPYFGLCLGMQVMCVEFARHVLKLSDANSTEIDPKTPHPIVSLLSEQKGIEEMGGTMRLGAYPCELTAGSKAAEAYGALSISERHRHRFELNDIFKDSFQKNGLIISGTLPKQGLSSG